MESVLGGALTVRVCVAVWQDGWTAFVLAAQKGHGDVVRALLEKGANADLQSKVSLVCVCARVAVEARAREARAWSVSMFGG